MGTWQAGRVIITVHHAEVAMCQTWVIYKTPQLLLLTQTHVYTKYNLEEKLKQQMLHKFLEFYRYMNGKEGHDANYCSRH